ncbi:MAG: flagellar biosynthesis anti-sigma factor FlgM [Phycisphaerae bacterium]|nr:flagellar biosynthesis anti-sigma factor FlgM [Phycisphaerae bacterium]
MNSLNPIASSTSLRGDAARVSERRPAVEVQVHAEPVDTVDLSERARLLDALRSQPDFRPEVVDRVKGEIERGTYLTDEKLDKALDALINDFLA